jgi:hypothetical protein
MMKNFVVSLQGRMKNTAVKVSALVGIGGTAVVAGASHSFAAVPAPVTVDMTGLKPPISTGDLITGATAFLGPYAPFILLAAALIFAPVLVSFVLWIVKKTRSATAK